MAADKAQMVDKQEEITAMAAWQFMGSQTGELWRLTQAALTQVQGPHSPPNQTCLQGS